VSLYLTIENDIKESMKAKDKVRLNALRFFKSRLIENKTSTKPQDEFDVLVSHYKKLKDSLASFPEGNEIRMSTEQELKVLEAYLPKPLTEPEVRTIIQNICQATPGVQMGIVMKELTPQIKGRFDGKRASDLVKEVLAGK
jgi:uncharacterized protein YqeY